jgi:hypothetical protein
MSFTHVVARRIKAGRSSYPAGQVVDATNWKNRGTLVMRGYLEVLPRHAEVQEQEDGTFRMVLPKPEVKVVAKAAAPKEESVTYPKYVPVGKYEFSNGEVKRIRKADAYEYEESLHG